MDKDDIQLNREDDWLNLMEKYDNFFYADDGILTASLLDNELEQYKWDFDKIKNLIQELKNFENKYGKLKDTELDNLIERRNTLMDLRTDTNKVEEAYKKMSFVYVNGDGVN